MINCVVVFGGESCEHDISIVTGGQVVNKLDEYLSNGCQKGVVNFNK